MRVRQNKQNMENAERLFAQMVEKAIYDSTVIIVMNPLNIAELDASDFTSDVWIVPCHMCERDKSLMLKEDSELKRELYDFFSKNQDRVWKGSGVCELKALE